VAGAREASKISTALSGIPFLRKAVLRGSAADAVMETAGGGDSRSGRTKWRCEDDIVAAGAMRLWPESLAAMRVNLPAMGWRCVLSGKSSKVEDGFRYRSRIVAVGGKEETTVELARAGQ